MKTMTCKQLAGACDMEFHAETFEEMGELSKKHAMEMAEKGDQAHIDKMEEMKENSMNKPEDIKEWFEKVQKEFNELPEDK
jgi:hypothetical protein